MFRPHMLTLALLLTACPLGPDTGPDTTGPDTTGPDPDMSGCPGSASPAGAPRRADLMLQKRRAAQKAGRQGC